MHGGTSPSKSVMLNVRGGERVAMNQNFQSLKMANNGDDSNYAKKTSKLDKMLGWYNYQLEKRPAVTKILSSGVIGAVGDILSQLLVQRKTASLLDWRSVAVFATVCGLYFAPVLDVWFAFLGRVSFPKSWSDTGRAAAMTVVDQTVGAALVTSGFFFAFELVHSVDAVFVPFKVSK